MSLTRRSFVGRSSERARTGCNGTRRLDTSGFPRFEVSPPPLRAEAFAKAIGEKIWSDLPPRLAAVNADIRAHGLRTIPGVNATLLTGYPYNEFYDWDLYFENLYLSYYGVWQYCFTNLREFLDREQPDGYVNRSLIKQRDRQHFKPFLAQLVVLGCKQNKNDYEWVRGKLLRAPG